MSWNVIPFYRIVFLIPNTDICKISFLSLLLPLLPCWYRLSSQNCEAGRRAEPKAVLGDLPCMGCYIRAEQGPLSSSDAADSQRLTRILSHSWQEGETRVSFSKNVTLSSVYSAVVSEVQS